MTVHPGTRIGSYEIVAPLGAGGMGEVYRARDTRLDRDVAIKILPDAFASDPDRVMRFEREAKTLASLNHPHIAQIYGLEGGTAGGASVPSAGAETAPSVLIMELVDGEDLSQRIARGPVPIDETRSIARQIADALGAAHDAGIIHRDLKPANIKVRADGTVKVLDFGLAKLGPAGPTAANAITSPAMTMQGVILGTAAYMAPEQARGYPVDKRADIWAFGVIVYEMLTGTSLFSGKTVTDTLAHVVTREPDWTNVPPAARRLLQSCLEREPQRRLRDLGDAWRLWDDAPVQVSPRRSMLVPIIGTAVATAALTLLAVSYVLTPIEAPDVVRLQMTLPAGAQAETAFVLSPDGRRIAMHGVGSDGVRRVWLRELDQLETRPLPGAENAATGPIFWSRTAAG